MSSKYLILKTGALGDISFFIPAIEHIRKKDPHAQITWICSSLYSDLLRAHPHIHQVITIREEYLFQGSLWEKVWEVFQLWRRLDTHYDQIWIGHRTLSAFLLLRLRTWGKFFQILRKNSYFQLLRQEIVVPPLSVHESLAFKQLTEKALQVKILLPAWKTDWSWIPSVALSLPSAYSVLHIGGGTNAQTEFLVKKWPHWRSFIQKLSQIQTLPIVLVGGPSEVAECEAILQALNPGTPVISKVGKTTFFELIHILRGAQFFVGVDSGPLHLADSLGVLCIGIYGPTSPISWGLLDSKAQTVQNSVHCSPCYQDDGNFLPCPYHHECMVNLNAEDVLRRIPKLNG